MNLFNLNLKEQNSFKFSPNNTQLGYVYFDFELLGESVIKQPTFISKSKGNIITRWDLQVCIIELLTFDFKPSIPPSMSLDGCFCGIYRVKAKKDSLHCTFKCILQDGDMSPETGESLVAVTCEDPTTILSIGTEDEERLQMRSRYGNWLPKRIESAIHPDTIQILKNGVQVHLPALMKDEQAQIHFIVAYAANTPRNQAATWFAVDQNLLKMFPDL